MIVVADSSPVIVLVNIGHIDILPALFGHVIVPPEIAQELAQANRPQPVRDLVAARPAWLVERAPVSVEPIPGLHPGELAAISLARELNADLLLIDEVRGRQAAADRNLRVAGTVGILELAADRALVDLNSAFERIKQTDFWISPKLLDERLRLRTRNQP
jgi:predicted nucleic acid-binding protein